MLLSIADFRMIFCFLVGVSSAFAFKRAPCISSHSFIRRCTADDNDQVIQNFLERKFNTPVIFSKQHLFGNSVDEVITSMDEIESSDSNSDNSQDSKKSLRGTRCLAIFDRATGNVSDQLALYTNLSLIDSANSSLNNNAFQSYIKSVRHL